MANIKPIESGSPKSGRFDALRDWKALMTHNRRLSQAGIFLSPVFTQYIICSV
ncbi:MAG: hypothetical protein AB1631_30100 [Acidobacteriota bacterium]